MSSNASAPTLVLDPRPSSRLALLLVLLHVAVAVALLLALPSWWSLPAVGLLGVLLWHEWRGSRRRINVRRDAGGDWWLDGAGPFTLQPATLVTPWLVVLILRGRPGTRRLALLPDSLAAVQWRRLRVALRVERAPDARA